MIILQCRSSSARPKGRPPMLSKVHGAYGCSDEYPVERFYRNSKALSIYEGTREVHKLMQANYALGIRKDKPRRCNLPPWPLGEDA